MNYLTDPLIWLLAVAVTAAAIAIYHLLKPKEKTPSSKQAQEKKRTDTAAEVDAVLRKAHIDPSPDFRVGRSGSGSDESLNSTDLLEAEALSRRVEHDTEAKKSGGSNG